MGVSGRVPDCDRAQYVQDFAKHGFKDFEEDCPCSSAVGEALMLAGVVCYETIYGKATPLMSLYSTRLYLERPELTLPDKRAPFVEGGEF